MEQHETIFFISSTQNSMYFKIISKSYLYRILFLCLGILLDKAIIQAFGLSDAGVYFSYFNLIMVVATFSRFGMDNYYLVNRISDVNNYLALVGLSSVVLIPALLLFARIFSINVLINDGVAICITAFVINFLFIFSLYFQVQGKIFIAYLFQFNLFYIIVLLILLVMLRSNVHLNVTDVYLFGGLILLVAILLIVFLLKKGMQLNFANLRVPINQICDNWLYSVISIMQFTQVRSLVLLSTILLASSEVAIFAVILKISLGLVMFNGAVNMILLPRAKRLFFDFNAVQFLYLSLSVIGMFSFVNLLFYFMSVQILTWFGADFLDYISFARIFVLIQTISIFTNLFSVYFLSTDVKKCFVFSSIGLSVTILVILLLPFEGLWSLAIGLAAGYTTQITYGFSNVFVKRNG